MKETGAYKWEIIGIDNTAGAIKANFICPYCNTDNPIFTYGKDPALIASGYPFSFECECIYCMKKVEVICDWSTLKDSDRVKIYATYWTYSLTEWTRPDEYKIEAEYNCPFCHSNNYLEFLIDKHVFESKSEYIRFCRCPCCGKDNTVALQNSDKYRSW